MTDPTSALFIALKSKRAKNAIPLTCVSEQGYGDWRADAEAGAVAWCDSHGFAGQAGATLAVPEISDLGSGGVIQTIICGVPENPSLWDWCAVFESLGAGVYRIGSNQEAATATQAALAFALSSYAFTKPGKTPAKPIKTLVWPERADQGHVLRAAKATALARTLVMTPANLMGPDALAAAARDVAKSHNAKISVIVGDDLLKQGYPAIHAVGRASTTKPRLIDLRWGNAKHPKVTLVGKGVTFDSGGLDLKPAGGMKFMKKDMGGAAQILGLATMMMDAKLPVRLRVLIPAVENSVAGNAMRPLDVLETRSGLTIEVGNTDAEGRVILADALYEAASEHPHLIVDCATLTGAARVALGTELPVMFTNDDATADQLVSGSADVDDPLWRLPLWRPYARQVVAKTADLTNAPDVGTGGAITAALFLERFVNTGASAGASAGASDTKGKAPVSALQSKASCGVNNGADGVPPWIHVDLMAYNTSSRPGRPEGGEAMGLRALYALIEDRFTTKGP